MRSRGRAARRQSVRGYSPLNFFSALFAIIVIDLVLAGDNAIVIALAARNLPKHLQRQAIVWGAVGAIAVRVLLTVVVVWLLRIPGLMFVGGALLIWSFGYYITLWFFPVF